MNYVDSPAPALVGQRQDTRSRDPYLFGVPSHYTSHALPSLVFPPSSTPDPGSHTGPSRPPPLHMPLVLSREKKVSLIFRRRLASICVYTQSTPAVHKHHYISSIRSNLSYRIVLCSRGSPSGFSAPCQIEEPVERHYVPNRGICDPLLSFLFFFSLTLHLSSFWASGGHRCHPFSPAALAYIFFIAHRVQQSHCSSFFRRVLPPRALALSASQLVRTRKSPNTAEV